MTRRERLLNKIEKREEWAQSRERKAKQLLAATDPEVRHDWAFITQPGHIPERARMFKRDEKAFENRQMANHHRERAKGLAAQVESSVYSDDPDAIEQLEAKISTAQAEQDRAKAVNAIIRAKPKNECTDEKVAKIVSLGVPDGAARKLFTPDFCGRLGFPDYWLQNNNANISRMRKRIEHIKAMQSRVASAEAAGGMKIERGGSYCRVTFAEKPDREILNALRGAGFSWGSGSWSGPIEKLPASVLAMETPVAS